jgi:hypothetical protein
MNRMALACIIAPLWVPLPVTALAYLVIFPHPAQHFWVAVTGVLSMIFSYGGPEFGERINATIRKPLERARMARRSGPGFVSASGVPHLTRLTSPGTPVSIGKECSNRFREGRWCC